MPGGTHRDTGKARDLHTQPRTFLVYVMRECRVLTAITIYKHTYIKTNAKAKALLELKLEQEQKYRGNDAEYANR